MGPFPSPGALLHPGIEPVSPVSPARAGGFFTDCATRSAPWREEPGRLRQWGLRVEHDWVTNTFSVINYPDIPCLPKSLVNTNNVVNFTLIYAVYVDALSCILPCSLCVRVCACVSCLVVSDSWQPHRPQPTRLLHPWNPGKTTRVGCHFLLQLPIVTIPYWSYGCQ